MPNLSIKNVPVDVVQRLRARATANHRSLQGELMALISVAVEPGRASFAAADAQSLVAGTEQGARSIEEIAVAHRQRVVEPIGAGPSAAEIIRAERDAR